MHSRYAYPRRWAAVIPLLMLTGCKSSEEPEVGVETGALGLQCRYGEIIKVGEISYRITSNGVAVRSGSFIGDLTTREDEFSAVIGPLPTGDNYVIALTARAVRTKSGESTACTGDASFGVAARQTTVVAVTLSCGGLRERGPDDNACPTLDSVRAVPAEAAVGGTLSLRADAHDPDRKLGPLQFTWSAREGVLTEATASRASFMCTTPGRTAITLQITDGDDTCPEESVTVYVRCKNAPAGAAGSFGAAGNGH